MSVWLLIDYIVTAAIAAELIPAGEADACGKMLIAENRRSYARRYGYRGPDIPDSRYVWTETPVLSGGALAKTLGCYRYQACESPAWEQSPSYQLWAILWDPVSGCEYDPATPWGWE